MYRIVFLFLIVTGLAVTGAHTTFAIEICVATGQTTEQVAPGITISWDSAFRCESMPDEGDYEFDVTISNDVDSVESVILETMSLTHTTPRPRGQAPEATGEATALPLVVAPGESSSFTVEGSYTLVVTGEGKKANLHFRASGLANDINDPFHLGINTMLRGEGAMEDDNEGSPPWVPGPPPWAGNDEGEPDAGPPADVPGPPPWINNDDDESESGPAISPPGRPDWVPGPPPGIGRPTGRGR